jgi:hypothetical protein
MTYLCYLTLQISAYMIKTYIHKPDFITIITKYDLLVNNSVDHFVDHLQENGFAGKTSNGVYYGFGERIKGQNRAVLKVQTHFTSQYP